MERLIQPPPPRTVVISGIVSDDPVEGATVKLKSLADGSVLATVTTGTGGTYSAPEIRESQLSAGWHLTATGGLMNGKPFIGTMKAVYSLTADYAASNVTLLTSAVTNAAEATVSDSTRLAQKVTEISTDAVARGVLPSNWRSVTAIADFLMTAADYQTAAVQGVDGVITRLTTMINFRPAATIVGTDCTIHNTQGDRVCVALIGAAGGLVRDQTGVASGNTVINVNSEATACTHYVFAWINASGNSVRYARLPLDLACRSPIGLVEVSLPPPIDINAAADACGSTDHPKMPHCITQVAPFLIAPGVFVSEGLDVDRKNDTRIWSNSLYSATHPTSSVMALIERKYGATLKRTRHVPGSDLLPVSVPVILIHGYVHDGGFGGDKETWGNMPQLISSLSPASDPPDPAFPNRTPATRFEVFNFQWRTNASLVEVGKDLAQAIEHAYAVTGSRKVHLVAHSFGGVLARVVLPQNLPTKTGSNSSARLWAGTASKVASLTTIGTPHSGINGGAGFGSDYLIEGVTLPVGWDLITGGATFGCFQISCYEAGGQSVLVDWAKNQLDQTGAGNAPPRGYVVAALAKHAQSNSDSPFPAGLKVLSLIGQTIPNILVLFTDSRFGTGDGLITYYGQRFEPVGSLPSPRLPLSFESPTLGGLVTERVLGLEPGVNAFPADPIGSIAIKPYMTISATGGYMHTNAFLLFTPRASAEAFVPAECGVVAYACQQDAWANVRAFLIAQHGGAASDNFPNTTGPNAIIVSGASCTAPVAGSAMTCTVTGANLPAGILFTATNCSPTTMPELAGGTTASRRFSCIPIQAGVAVGVTLTAVPGYRLALPVVPAVVATANPNPPSGRLNDTGITNLQCYAAGSYSFVSCLSAAALSLSDKQDGMIGRDVAVS